MSDHDPLCIWAKYFGVDEHSDVPCIGDITRARAEVAALQEQPCAHDMTNHDEKIAHEVREEIIKKLLSEDAVQEFGYGWHRVSERRPGYRKGDRRRAGLSAVADWLKGVRR